jgi:hypothetical protein
MRENPTISLREVARATGISPGTVRDVRERMEQGRAPELPSSSSACSCRTTEIGPGSVGYDQLTDDNALGATVDGRAFLEWFEKRAITADEWRPFLRAVPKSRVYMVAEAARLCARMWADFADNLEKDATRSDGRISLSEGA